jgi:chemotaxis protein CheC
MDTQTQLTDSEKNVLLNLANKGAGAASDAVSKMTNRHITLKVSRVYSFPIEKIGKLVSNAEAIVTTIYLKITGDIAGSILLVFPNDCALSLTDLLNGRKEGTTEHLSDFDKSTLKEVSNIISGSFLAILSESLDLSLIESIPDLTVDMIQATIDSVLIDFAKKAEEAISIEMNFKSDENTINGYFFVLFDTQSADVILKSISKKAQQISY